MNKVWLRFCMRFFHKNLKHQRTKHFQSLCYWLRQAAAVWLSMIHILYVPVSSLHPSACDTPFLHVTDKRKKCTFITWCKLSVNVNVIVNVYVESVDTAASSVLTHKDFIRK